jgi:hypothetical protein
MPPQLPPSLKMFLMNAPAVPVDGGVPGAVPPAGGMPPVAAAAFPPAPAPVEVKKMDISSAFGSVDDIPPASSSATTSFGGGSGGNVAISSTDDYDLRNSIDGIKNVAKKTIVAHEQAVEAQGKAMASLQGIKQRLATDRIALEATLANAMTSNSDSQARLEAVTQEIYQLQEHMRGLKLKLDETMKGTDQNYQRINKATEDKATLLREIDSLLKSFDTIQADSSVIADKLTQSERDVNKYELDNKNLQTTSHLLKSSIGETSRDNDDLKRILDSLKGRK